MHSLDAVALREFFYMDLRVHPLAKAIPQMLTDEYAELVADIKTNGLQVPLMLLNGMILDGQHRARACAELGIVPETITFAGAEATAKAYVLSLNVHRRHLTLAQKRGLILVELKRDPKQSDRTIAKKAKVSHHTVAKTRTEAEGSGQIAQTPERKYADGRTLKKPAKKTAKEKKPVLKPAHATKPKDLDALRILKEIAAIEPSDLSDPMSFGGSIFFQAKRFGLQMTFQTR